jgi:hypothetical protein
MTIELPREMEMQLRDTASAQGVSVSQYLELLVAETNLRRQQLAEFRTAITERMASLEAGDRTDGEAIMARLIAELAPR